ncbi:hypothetical protein V493_02385 [Pseudogymnoascus sp. VKM F-4281 (FW-2241)]|nr:hypothetical protein V493_02385 [Pseudogymnoascus sp. VKM F-4281 (FW-2241)]
MGTEKEVEHVVLRRKTGEGKRERGRLELCEDLKITKEELARDRAEVAHSKIQVLVDKVLLASTINLIEDESYIVISDDEFDEDNNIIRPPKPPPKQLSSAERGHHMWTQLVTAIRIRCADQASAASAAGSRGGYGSKDVYGGTIEPTTRIAMTTAHRPACPGA